MANAVHIYAGFSDPGYLEAIKEESECVLVDNRDKYIKQQMFSTGKTLLRLAAIEEGREELVDKVIEEFKNNIG